MKYTIYYLCSDFALTVLDRVIPTRYAIASDKVFYFLPSTDIASIESSVNTINIHPELYHSRSSILESLNFKPEMLTEIATFDTIRDLELNYPELSL